MAEGFEIVAALNSQRYRLDGRIAVTPSGKMLLWFNDSKGGWRFADFQPVDRLVLDQLGLRGLV